jgi:hypothetical protein
MSAGTIPVANIPGWPNPPPGLMPACQKSLDDAQISGSVSMRAQGLHTPDVANTTAVLNSYSGGTDELNFAKNDKQTRLDTLVDENFDLKAFIRDGTITTVTGANVGNYLAQITNNYRSLRSQIANAASVAAVNAINLNQGWPSNP